MQPHSVTERKFGSVVKTAITCEMNCLDFRFDPIPTGEQWGRDAEFRFLTDYRKGLVATRIGGSAEIDLKRLHRKQSSAAPKIGTRVTVVSPELQGRPTGIWQGASSTYGIQVCSKRRFVEGGFALKASGIRVAPLPNGADSVIGYLETTRRHGDLRRCTFVVFAHRQINSHIDGTFCYRRIKFAAYVECLSELSRFGPQNASRANPA